MEIADNSSAVLSVESLGFPWKTRILFFSVYIMQMLIQMEMKILARTLHL